MTTGATTAAPGLRERKKASRRRTLSDVATRLFVERGFDAVTVAEVAEAAGVSVKTVFNYFGSKEELFFDREDELRSSVVRAVTDRAGGVTVSESLAALLSGRRVPVPDGDGWAALRDPDHYARVRAFLRTWEASPALRARQLVGVERLRDAVAVALAHTTGLRGGDPRIATWAAMIAAAVDLRHRTIAEAVLRGDPPRTVERRAKAVVAEAFRRIGAATGDLDRPA